MFQIDKILTKLTIEPIGQRNHIHIYTNSTTWIKLNNMGNKMDWSNGRNYEIKLKWLRMIVIHMIEHGMKWIIHEFNICGQFHLCLHPSTWFHMWISRWRHLFMLSISSIRKFWKVVLGFIKLSNIFHLCDKLICIFNLINIL